MVIKDSVYIGPSATVQAALIGPGVVIGEGCQVVRASARPATPAHQLCRTLLAPHQGPRVIIKDFARLRPGTVVPAGTVVPPFGLMEGEPGALCACDSAAARRPPLSRRHRADPLRRLAPAHALAAARLIGQVPDSAADLAAIDAAARYERFEDQHIAAATTPGAGVS